MECKDAQVVFPNMKTLYMVVLSYIRFFTYAAIVRLGQDGDTQQCQVPQIGNPHLNT